MATYEERANIKFCFRTGKTFTETFNLMKSVYGESVERSTVHLWFNNFKKGRESIENAEKSGRPRNSTNPDHVFEVRKLVRSDRRLTIREMADTLNISFGSVQHILANELKMSRVCAKFVPRILTEEQTENRLRIASDLLQTSTEDPSFLSKIVTGDETWIFGYDPETKVQSSQWITPKRSPIPKKARMQKSNIKCMLLLFFDDEGVVHHEFMPRGSTVNSLFYRDVLRRVREDVRRKRPSKWKNGWLLHHDNAPCYTSIMMREFLTKNEMTAVPHSPYSPDLAPCDFWMFPKLKSVLKGERFQSVEEIQRNTVQRIRSIPKAEFKTCFEKLTNRWRKCIDNNGKYFEGDVKLVGTPRATE